MNFKKKILIFIIVFLLILFLNKIVFGFYPAHLEFIDNGDGTISEIGGTSLMWVKCSADLSGDDCSIGILSVGTQTNATNYCDVLNFAGYSDWRLPTLRELDTIIDYNLSFPAIDETFFPNPYDEREYNTWSSNSYAGIEGSYWDIWFGDGFHYDDSWDVNNYYRCVRTIPATYMPNYILIKNTETGTEFYLDKTINYGDILLVVFLSIFAIFIIGKAIASFVFRQWD